MWAEWRCREGSRGLNSPSPSPHIIYPLLNPQYPFWLGVWEQCTLQTVGAVLARVMETAKVQAHSSGGGRIISPLLIGLGGGSLRRSGREVPEEERMEKPKAV